VRTGGGGGPPTTVRAMPDVAAGPKQLRRLLDAVTGLGSGLDLDVLLHRLVASTVELVDARYGALGVLDPSRTHLSAFITVGIDDETVARIGEPPKGHGILGLLIVDPTPIRLPDLNRHPDSFGFPPEHPPMTSFLGAPVFVDGVVYGNLYLTDKAGGGPFTEDDQEVAVAIAAAAGTAIANARLHERTRELELVEDRDRIARELHDTVIQRLFATGLSLQGAARLAQPIPDLAARIESCIDDLDLVVRQVRSSIFELHPPSVTSAGLRQQLLDLGDDVADALGYAPTFTFDGPVDASVTRELAGHVLAVVGEALANVARHADSPTASVRVRVVGGELEVVVTDEGRGPGDGRRAGGRGMTNMAHRAEQVGGRFAVEPGDAAGTRVTWQAPLP